MPLCEIRPAVCGFREKILSNLPRGTPIKGASGRAPSQTQGFSVPDPTEFQCCHLVEKLCL